MLQDFLTPCKTLFKDHTELRAQVTTTKQVTLLKGNMVANAQSATSGVCARVYKGGTFGFSSGADYTSDSVKAVLSAATDNALFMDKHVMKGDPPLPLLGQMSKVDLKKPVFTDVPQSQLIDFARGLDDLIDKKYKNLTSRTVVANCLYMEKLLRVSDGADMHFFQPRNTVYVFLTAETADGTPVELFEAICGIGRFDEFFTDPKLLEAKFDKLYQQLMDKREGVFANAGLKKCTSLRPRRNVVP